MKPKQEVIGRPICRNEASVGSEVCRGGGSAHSLISLTKRRSQAAVREDLGMVQGLLGFGSRKTVRRNGGKRERRA